jgi:GT2 family glycosyltransferase
MPNFTFVILHYQTDFDTISCVKSIKDNISYSSYSIVVVDNGSTNNSGEIVRDTFKDEPNFFFIQNTKNLGFAKGNNVGYLYAKNNLKSDFIALINNDTYIKQSDFVERIVGMYNLEPFHLLGPDIISVKDGSHQNPRIETLHNPDVLRKFIRYHLILYFFSLFNLDIKLEKLKKSLFPKSSLPSSIDKGEAELNLTKEQKGVKLHGSAIIYSPDFVRNYDYGFYPETFIYCEESILNYIAKQDKLVTVFYPFVTIFHTEDSATDSVFRKKYKKRQFYYKNFVRSSKVLLRLIMNAEKNKT